MFSILKNSNQKEGQSQNIVLDKVAAGIVRPCLQIQSKWAAYMQRKTNHLSATTKKISLALFCLFSLGCSFYLIIQSFTGNAKKGLGVAPIKMPVHSTQTGEENTRTYQLIAKEEAKKIRQFRQYMDNLSTTAAGIRKKDSLLSFRPGLMDSVRVIENLYRLQHLKK